MTDRDNSYYIYFCMVSRYENNIKCETSFATRFPNFICTTHLNANFFDITALFFRFMKN
jgi:hypothetical protein